jgi:hypothetical protein
VGYNHSEKAIMSSNNNKTSILFSVLISLYMAIGQVHAATMSLTPTIQNVALGNQVLLQLNMDFGTDPTLGGGVDILYNNSLLSFVSFAFDPGLGDDPLLQRQPDALSGTLNGLAFGNFDGLGGPSVVGTLIFNSIGAGIANFSLAENVFPAGGFFSATSLEPQVVTFTGASVNVTAVPLPAAGWFLLSGLGVLGGVRKKIAV